MKYCQYRISKVALEELLCGVQDEEGLVVGSPTLERSKQLLRKSCNITGTKILSGGDELNVPFQMSVVCTLDQLLQCLKVQILFVSSNFW